MTCPNCSGDARIIQTRITPKGRRRRLCCVACAYRWTVWNDELPASPPPKPAPLTEDDIRAILASTDSIPTLSARYRRRRDTIKGIQSGVLFADIAPDALRPIHGKSCQRCIHWYKNRCDLSFPDPLEEGLQFAEECSLYQGAA
jgi:hypothetical protein